MKPLRVLYVNGGIMDRGGISAYMMNYYRHMDKTQIQIDFIVHGFKKGVFDDEIILLGGKIYRIPIKSRDYFGNIKALRKIFSLGQYKIIHSHMDAMNAIILKEAKRSGIPIRIAHSHNTNHLTTTKLKYAVHEIAKLTIKRYATHLWACSEEAGTWLFGSHYLEEKNKLIVRNAIEVDKYSFNIGTRNYLRKKYNLENNFVVGHVGRFDYQKNHMFIIEVFYRLQKMVPNARLVLIGDGHLREKIESRIAELNMCNSVLLLGQQPDVYNIMNMMDVFILPSLFEGLAVSAVEAQANGLRCLISSNISKDLRITDNIDFLGIEDTEEWIEKLRQIRLLGRAPKIDKVTFYDCGYQIESAATTLENTYIELAKGVS